jgi:hypothetical protein
LSIKLAQWFGHISAQPIFGICPVVFGRASLVWADPFRPIFILYVFYIIIVVFITIYCYISVYLERAVDWWSVITPWICTTQPHTLRIENYETYVNSLAHPDNVQNLYARCAGSMSGSHLQVKDLSFISVPYLRNPMKDFKAHCDKCKLRDHMQNLSLG